MFTWAPDPVRKKQTSGPTRNEWEQYKDLILEEYHKYSLAHVKEYMLVHHNFIARDDQWNYRLYKVWNVKQPKAANRSKTSSETIEHAEGVQTSEVSAHSRIGNIIPPATIHEEQEFHTPHAEPSRRTSMHSEASSGNAMRWRSESPNWPQFDRKGYASNNTYSSVSSRSASPYERNNSAASSYYQLDGVKRTASLSSQSSAPSSKRVKSSGYRSAVSTSAPQEDEEEEQAFPAKTHISLKDTKTWADGQVGRDVVPLRPPPTNLPRPGRLNLKPMVTKRELVFPCFQSPTGASYVRVRNVNPHALPEQCTDDDDTVDITSLPWEDMHNLNVAAEIFSACRMHRQGFKMHYQIFLRISESTYCPSADANGLLLRQILACSRTAETRLDLQKCRSILNDQLGDSCTTHDVKSLLRLRMALADTCMKQGDWNGVREHRALACEVLRDNDQSIILDEWNASPDFVADFTALRAYALKASMDIHLQKARLSSRSYKREEDANVQKFVGEAEERLAEAQKKGILKVLRWCRNQLNSVQQADLIFLRGCFGEEPKSTPAIKRLNIAALFGLFLMRMHGTSTPQEPEEPQLLLGRTTYLDHGLDNMEASSPADILWIIAAAIVERMNATTIARVLSSTYFDHACMIATDLLRMNWPTLSSRIFSVMKVELSNAQHQGHYSQQSPRTLANDPWLGAATKLVEAIVRRDFGIVLEGSGLDLEPSYQPVVPSYNAMSIGLGPSSNGPIASGRGSQTKLTTHEGGSSIHLNITTSSRSDRSSPWSSMRRMKDQGAQAPFSSWIDTMPQKPSSYVRRKLRQAFGRDTSIDGISDSMQSTSISNIQSPRESLRIGSEANSSSPYKLDLTLKTLQGIHERVALLFPRI